MDHIGPEPAIRPRPTLARRLDAMARASFPLACTTLLMLLTAVPFGIADQAQLLPAVTLSCVWFWSLFRPASVPAPAVFLLGLFLDLLGYLPLGVGTLTLLFVQALALRWRAGLVRRGFVVVWLVFFLVAAGGGGVRVGPHVVAVVPADADRTGDLSRRAVHRAVSGARDARSRGLTGLPPTRSVPDMRRETKRVGVFTRRALLLMGAEVTALGLLAGKLYQVQVVNGDRYLTMAEENRISARLVAPPRGRILDRFGTAVAGNKLNWRALLIAEQTEDVGLTLDNLARIVALSDNERVRIEREVHRHRRFIPTMVREFLTWDEMARIEVHAPDLPGILIDVGTTRVYPFSDKLAHIVGYVAPPSEADTTGDDPDPMLSLPGMRVGRAGIEKFHDAALRGRAGVVQLEVNAVGRVIRELDRQEGVPGTEIGLTVDSELQKQVLDRLGDESASAVVMDCRNGEVLAMATNPSFDPSLFNSGVSQAQWIEWTRNRRTPLINKAAAGLYAPGSTFKMAVALAALDAKTLSPTDRIHCPGFLDLGDTRFHCWRKGGHGIARFAWRAQAQLRRVLL